MNRWTFDDWRLLSRAKGGEWYGRTVVVALIGLLIFGATFRAGIDRGMDRLVSMEGYGRILNAIAAVMTEQRFHQGGYALSNCIQASWVGVFVGEKCICTDSQIDGATTMPGTDSWSVNNCLTR